MDKDFWQELMQNKYAIPDGHTIDELTAELFTYIGNTDPDLRDDIGYMVYANWLSMDFYPQEIIAKHISTLTANLKMGINEKGTDSVFQRTFSILFLAEIIHNDNKDPKLEKKVIDELLESALWYLEHEQDPRGYVQGKGWAHALAHTADLMRVLAKNEHSGLKEHKRILNGIVEKLINSSDWVYVHGEDDRLSAAALGILKRDMLPVSAIKEWTESFTAPNWKGAWTDEERTRSFFNVRNFLRSLYLQVATDEELPNQDELETVILITTQELRPY